MLIHNLYPVGATIKNLHTGAIKTIKFHGIASTTDEGETLDLHTAGGSIWKSYNVEVLDTPNTAQAAYDFFHGQTVKGVMGYCVTKEVAFECLVNMFIREVASIDIVGLTVDFNDGSLITFKAGSWVANGFYAQIQDRRA
ncbi:MAG: hypothetical protein JKX78_03675 [Alteromonadaceae bacterium]|nr:hypothetical protein [Alteromonadaceae bacterium]MBL4909118.1 hypothetical protein [Alteromonadaceae bacterium]